MIDYTIMYKSEFGGDSSALAETEWDVFISSYTLAERIGVVFETARAANKHWLVFPEYGFTADEYPSSAYVCESRDEAEAITGFWDDRIGDLGDSNLGIDITGFVRPYLIFLVRWLAEKGVTRFDAVYSEPIAYKKREETRFSDGTVLDVRQVAGFEGVHSKDESNDYLVMGAGYDHQLIAQVSENKKSAKKMQLFGMPSLRADMYQENVLRAYLAMDAVGRHTTDEDCSFFAPANDPFVTASILREIVDSVHKQSPITNLYLSPLSTKAQTLGFALYFITERLNTPTSLIFPFCASYDKETSTGISRIWRYTVELPRI